MRSRKISEAQIRALENKCARAQFAFEKVAKLLDKAQGHLVDLQLTVAKLKPKENLKRLPDEDAHEYGDKA